MNLHDPCCFIAGFPFYFWGLTLFITFPDILQIQQPGNLRPCPIPRQRWHQMLMIFNKLLQVNEGMTQFETPQKNKMRKNRIIKTFSSEKNWISLIVPFVFFSETVGSFQAPVLRSEDANHDWHPELEHDTHDTCSLSGGYKVTTDEDAWTHDRKQVQ